MNEAVAVPPAIRRASLALRLAPAIVMVIHGSFRILSGGVQGFGSFLDSQHVPFGPVVAWVLSLVEVAGGLTLASGRFVRPLCFWFALELLNGVLLVHIHDGWFVVGGGRNGMEYSVLLIICFLIVSVLDPAVRRSST